MLRLTLIVCLTLTSQLVFQSCRTTNSALLQDDEVKPLPPMSKEEFEDSLTVSEKEAEERVLESIGAMSDAKLENPALRGLTEIKAGETVIEVEDIPTIEENIEEGETLKTVGGGFIDNAKTVLSTYFNDPNIKPVVVGASVGAVTALVFNQVSQRSGKYYRYFVLSLNKWVDQSVKFAFVRSGVSGSLKKAINSTASTRVSFKFGKKFYKSMEKSVGISGFKPATLAIGSSVVASSLAAYWSYSDYQEEEITEVESTDEFEQNSGPQFSSGTKKDELAEMAKNYGKILQWDKEKTSVFYKAAVSDIIGRIPKVAAANNGKITNDTIIPFDPLAVIKRVNAVRRPQFPNGYLTTDQHIAKLEYMMMLSSEKPDSDEFKNLSEKDVRILNHVDNLDMITASTFIMQQMINTDGITPKQKLILQEAVRKNQETLAEIKKNYE